LLSSDPCSFRGVGARIAALRARAPLDGQHFIARRGHDLVRAQQLPYAQGRFRNLK
jgi:hypothetical protein